MGIDLREDQEVISDFTDLSPKQLAQVLEKVCAKLNLEVVKTEGPYYTEVDVREYPDFD